MLLLKTQFSHPGISTMPHPRRIIHVFSLSTPITIHQLSENCFKFSFISMNTLQFYQEIELPFFNYKAGKSCIFMVLAVVYFAYIVRIVVVKVVILMEILPFGIQQQENSRLSHSFQTSNFVSRGILCQYRIWV